MSDFEISFFVELDEESSLEMEVKLIGGVAL
jgi:hypothetical protein